MGFYRKMECQQPSREAHASDIKPAKIALLGARIGSRRGICAHNGLIMITFFVP